MNTVLYKAASRGHADHGWLNAYHTFSFADYYNPERINFGALRVLNDDVIAGDTGFGTHPHKEMEIVTIPLYGSLKHEDSIGNSSVIKAGEIQLMSAGTGVFHSEANPDVNKPVNLFQIWVIPNESGAVPRYAQTKIDIESNRNQLVTLVSPKGQTDTDMWIHQDAWFNMGIFDKGQEVEYKVHKPHHGLFIMNIGGEFEAAEQKLELRDAVGVWNTPSVKIKAETNHARILVIEVPMDI